MKAAKKKAKAGGVAAATPYQSYESISRATGRDRRTVRRILDGAEMKPSHPDALELVKASEPEDLRKDANSPSARIGRAEADLVERKNRIAQKLEDDTYIEIEKVDKVLRIMIAKLEVIPTKMQSEFGLPDGTMKRLRGLLDECRQEAAKEICDL